MSNFKKPVDSTCWTQKGKRQCSKERGIQIKQRRREMYRARSVDKRELNLLERRTTYLHSRKQNPTSDSTEVSAFYQFNRELARQRAALTGASSSTLTTGLCAKILLSLNKLCDTHILYAHKLLLCFSKCVHS